MPWGDRGSTWAYRKIRKQVLDRDQWRCRLKLDGCLTIATDAHHLDGFSAGHDPNRMVAACHPCNAREGDPTAPPCVTGTQRTIAPDPDPVPRTAW